MGGKLVNCRIFNALTGDNEDEDFDDYEGDDWNELNDITAWDCVG